MILAHSETCRAGLDCDCEAGKTLYDPGYKPKHEDELHGRWIECESCDDLWCLAHHEHAFECPCPSTDALPPHAEEQPMWKESHKH